MSTLATSPDTTAPPAGDFARPHPEPPSGGRPARLAAFVSLHAGALLPAALVLFFSFQAGGFFAGATGVAAGALAVVLTLRVTLVERPFAGIGAAAGVCAAALAAYAAWTLVSSQWSDAPARAVLEFDRALLYLLAFLVAATSAWDARRLALGIRAAAGAVVVVCLVGWGSRVLPELIASDPGAVPERLSHPLTYWNTQGLIAALGLLLVVHLACSPREGRLVRVAAAAATPVVASTLFLTFSRGALLAALVGLAAYLVLVRSRSLLGGALAVVPATAVAVMATFDADLLATDAAKSAAAAAQGRDVVVAVVLCAVGAGLLRLAADRWLDPRLRRVALPARARRPVRALALVALLVVLVPLPIALGAPDYLQRSYERFVDETSTSNADLRTRFVSPANNGRVDSWRVAVETWREHPVRGTGAGTFATQWTQGREIGLDMQDAHSLYLELLSDLGVVGFALLIAFLGTLVVTAVRRAHRGRSTHDGDRSRDAVVVAVLLAWAVHAGLDWVWETPAVTAWVFALGGIAVAARRRAGTGTGLRRSVRVAIGLGCLVLAAIPVQVVRSQTALDDAVQAFRGTPQDCPAAIDASLTSLAALAARAEPWEIVAYCDVGQDEPQLAVRAARNAVARDPENWVYRYALALVQGVAGEDPRPAAARAFALNPGNELTGQAVTRFRSSPRRDWPRIARELELPTG